MIRRLAGVLLAACALSALLVADASSEVPPGPRLSFMQLGRSGPRLVTSNPAGGEQAVIADGSDRGGPIPFGPAAWSADGTRVAFPGVARGGAFGGIYLARADGSAPKPILGTQGASHPVLSPDGETLAFTRERERLRRAGGANETVYDSISIWIVRRGGGKGALRLNGSQAGVLAKNAREPVYSPDGTRLALTIVGRPRPVEPGVSLLFSPTDIALANADGSGLTRLTRTPREVEQEPSWDPSGERLAFTQHGVGPSGYGGIGDSLMEINADGTCRTKVLSYPRGILFGATWQPGPGREAARIAC